MKDKLKPRPPNLRVVERDGEMFVVTHERKEGNMTFMDLEPLEEKLPPRRKPSIE